MAENERACQDSCTDYIILCGGGGPPLVPTHRNLWRCGLLEYLPDEYLIVALDLSHPFVRKGQAHTRPILVPHPLPLLVHLAVLQQQQVHH